MGQRALGTMSRRDCLKGATAVWAMAQGGWGGIKGLAAELPHGRPPKTERHFTSAAVEALIPRVQGGMGDQALATIFENCFPNTLDTTVYPGSFEGKPDTYIVTGDIDAMWLRDSSAQLWPYLPLAKEDAPLRDDAGVVASVEVVDPRDAGLLGSGGEGVEHVPAQALLLDTPLAALACAGRIEPRCRVEGIGALVEVFVLQEIGQALGPAPPGLAP